ncbi:PA1571 family protein [Zestomonas carbonaria]|uniref:Multifunctional fatty acid oxidation complex subunit alpha n=1 Tax=Zestomonas carbonaria TaxID=2762745 RepID=A0A7U7ES64_9GAMM|nr:PA1571 family protein [Pseudomonas carbonaria]CAD5110115.1 hypothetical protein PSEWESI4_04431 [Pseudomonas carbonaria]
MSLQNTNSGRRTPARPPQQPVGGAIIDAQGREIPITEQMVQRACREMDKTCMGSPKKD